MQNGQHELLQIRITDVYKIREKRLLFFIEFYAVRQILVVSMTKKHKFYFNSFDFSATKLFF